MTIEAQIICDSVNKYGNRLTTFQLRYPRFIHAELMTHRVFSRNASSSRAIPVKRMIEDIRRDPAMPVYWGFNQAGMQADRELKDVALVFCQTMWLEAMDSAIHYVEQLVDIELHKQIANRILEPWAHTNVVVTATEYSNFFMLRRHKDAQPEIKALADAMWDAREASEPEYLEPGKWHLPYIRKDETTWEYALANIGRDLPVLELLRRVSAARCARVSYLTHDGRKTSVKEDLELYDRLVGGMPLHASPTEHQATPDSKSTPQCENDEPKWHTPELHGNFTGWNQHRKLLNGEYTPG